MLVKAHWSHVEKCAFILVRIKLQVLLFSSHRLGPFLIYDNSILCN